MKKLKLNKETISVLGNAGKKLIKGGDWTGTTNGTTMVAGACDCPESYNYNNCPTDDSNSGSLVVCGSANCGNNWTFDDKKKPPIG